MNPDALVALAIVALALAVLGLLWLYWQDHRRG